MIFFTKTCARDWPRCCYQILAIRRKFPLTTHIVMIEDADFAEACLTSRDVSFFVDRGVHKVTMLSVSDPLFESKTLVCSVETFMPEAMRIKNPDLRQQYCKIMAPIVFGEDMIQLDSDMCPRPGLDLWMDELYRTRGDSRARWNAPPTPKAIEGGMRNWLQTWSEALHQPEVDFASSLDFMRSQFGWYIARDLARDFVRKVLGDDPVGTILRVTEQRYKFSEYQFLGMYAHAEGYPYRFLYKAEADPWLMHFSSKEPLEPGQLMLLRKAAGVEDDVESAG